MVQLVAATMGNNMGRKVGEAEAPVRRHDVSGVNTIHPEPEIHEQIYMTKGYGTLSSVSTEQWQPYARNLKTTKIERDNL